MKKNIITIAAALAAAIMLAGPVSSAATKPSYRAPQSPTIAFATDTTLEVVFTASPYANFYQVRYSTHSDMTGSTWVKSQDVNVNGFTVEGLQPGTRYYVQASVTNWEGVRLSPWSVTKSARTATEPTQ